LVDCILNNNYTYKCDRGIDKCVMFHDCERCGTEHSRIEGCNDTDQLMRFDQDMRAIYPLYNSETWDM
jgi:hypothetical protein